MPHGHEPRDKTHSNWVTTDWHTLNKRHKRLETILISFTTMSGILVAGDENKEE